jgi:hypothetical protein
MVINTDPSRRELLVFGFVLPLTFAILGTVIGRIAGSNLARNVVWLVGAGLSVVYLAVAALRRPMFVGASRISYPIGWVVSHVMLLVIFWIVVTPIGLLVRLFGEDPMRRRFDDSVGSYWEPRTESDDLERYFHQS